MSFLGRASSKSRLLSSVLKITSNKPLCVFGALAASSVAYAGYNHYVLSKPSDPGTQTVSIGTEDILDLNDGLITSVIRVPTKPGEARFRVFASLNVDGEPFMTPSDFLDAMIQERPKPRIKPKLVPPETLKMILDSTPTVDQYVELHRGEDPCLLREIGERGIISFVEYLFLLSILTRPSSGFRVAFDLIDISREDSIMKSEYHKFCMMSSNLQKRSKNSDLINLSSGPEDTTLIRHFFGPDGRHKLSYEEFAAFLTGLQREGQNRYFSRLGQRIPRSRDRPMLTFPEVELFFSLVNNISDFQYAFFLYPQMGRKLSREEFNRASKISLDGQELSEKIVDVIFALFDQTGEDSLSSEEFFTVIKNRLNRQVRKSFDRTGWNAFKSCLKEEIRKG
ncbi:hypothetical protein TCAL_08930 [Tigriopus californicus]|uniref:EF-hand domain-containing protein n=1 Tax=Tigriopus californicus TaxID=6832 RepID=A0A553PQQ7_TIGCA|nr:hypothetical protein TCAL_08930 [Tigriopus californicus]